MAESILNKVILNAGVSATQGSADAFVAAALQTGMSPASRFGWKIEKVEIELDVGLAAAPQTSDCNVEVALTQTAEDPTSIAPHVATPRVICKRSLILPGIAAAVNAYAVEGLWVWVPPPNFVVVASQLWLELDSANTGVANVASCRIFYFPIQLSEIDILRLNAILS